MNVYKFYNKDGWTHSKKGTKDAILFEDLRPVAKKYVSYCRYKINNFLPKNGKNILDFASGPIQYKEYLTYSKNFKKRHCVDFSKAAIKLAKKKIGIKGKFYCDDFLKIKFKKNYFDSIISLHTIYHISKKDQKRVVEKLISISKKNSPIVIVYSNPNTILNFLKKIFIKNKDKEKDKDKLYFYCHKLDWWMQFSKIAKVEFHPWRSFSAQHQKKLFPNNFIGKVLFELLILFEKMFPKIFVKYFQYPMIILRKN